MFIKHCSYGVLRVRAACSHNPIGKMIIWKLVVHSKLTDSMLSLSINMTRKCDGGGKSKRKGRE